MKTLSMNIKPSELTQAIGQIKSLNPQLLIVMGATDVLKDGAVVKQLADQLVDTQIVGCSTAGDIDNDGVSDGGVVIAAAHFEGSQVRTVSEEILAVEDSRAVGGKIVKALLAPDLKAVFVVAPGVNINGSELVLGMREYLPAGVSLTGGLAGDGTRFQETRTILGGQVYPSRVVAIGFYGDRLVVGSGSKGGWKPFGPARRVTKVAGNVLYELDGKPALELYKSYLGDKAAELPASGLLYPFAILNSDRSATGLIRTILNVDHANNSLILAGDIPAGSTVCLMHAGTDDLVDGASVAAKDAAGGHTTLDETLSICVSCVGRRLVMGEDADEEIEAALDVFGKSTSMVGFYSYGEIAPFSETGNAELHNQTMTITHIYELAA